MGGRERSAFKIVTGSQNDKLSLKTAGAESNGKGITEAHTLCCTKQESKVARPDKSAITVRVVMDSVMGNVVSSKYLPS